MRRDRIAERPCWAGRREAPDLPPRRLGLAAGRVDRAAPDHGAAPRASGIRPCGPRRLRMRRTLQPPRRPAAGHSRISIVKKLFLQCSEQTRGTLIPLRMQSRTDTAAAVSRDIPPRSELGHGRSEEGHGAVTLQS